MPPVPSAAASAADLRKIESVFRYFWEDLFIPDLNVSGPFFGRITEQNYREFGLERHTGGVFVNLVQIKVCVCMCVCVSEWVRVSVLYYFVRRLSSYFLSQEKIDKRAYKTFADFALDFELMFTIIAESFAASHPVISKAHELRQLFYKLAHAPQ